MYITNATPKPRDIYGHTDKLVFHDRQKLVHLYSMYVMSVWVLFLLLGWIDIQHLVTSLIYLYISWNTENLAYKSAESGTFPVIPIEDPGGEADGIVDRVMITRRCTEH